MTAYTHYWKNNTWDEQLYQPLEHAASNAFRARGVGKGDRVFIVTIRKGQLFVGGRLVVDKITTQKGAEKLLGTALWTARDHIVARTPLRVLQSVPVPNKIARRLRFVPDGDLVWASPGELDRQTLRGVRRLTDESAALLDDILAQNRTTAGIVGKGGDYGLLSEHRTHIRSADAQAAFDELTSSASLLSGFDCAAGWHGEIRDIHYVDRATGERPFAFIVNRKDILFYVRAAGLKRVPGGLEALKAVFTTARENPSGEWTVHIANANEARRLSEVVFASDLLVGDEDPEDDAEQKRIEQRTDIGPREKLRLMQSRLGQGIYRANLYQMERCCRVTGVADPRHLRASHIKPWCKCDDCEKLDGYNGLLLSPHVDHLFDRGYISFSDAGELMVSKALPVAVLTSWGIALPGTVVPFRPEQCRYLAYHRKHRFKG